MTHAAPYFPLARAVWILRVLAWDTQTGKFQRIEAPRGSRATAAAEGVALPRTGRLGGGK